MNRRGSSREAAGRATWPRWLKWPARPPVEPRAQYLYGQLLTRLQREMLLFLMVLTVPFGLFLAVGLAGEVRAQAIPPAALAIHVGNILLTMLVAALFLWRQRVVAAWVGILTVNLSLILVQVGLLREPGVLLFALFVLVAPALVAPWWLSLLPTVALVGALGLLARLFPFSDGRWLQVTSLFAVIMSALAGIGLLLRRIVAHFALASIEMEREAARRGRLEQRVVDLSERVRLTTSLEHDLRQPLRVVQGYLQLLGADLPPPVHETLLLPALAVTQRSSRLVNNLLELARVDANQPQSLYRPLCMAHFFEALRPAAAGLARYYTDPPVAIHFEAREGLPMVVVDRERLERALMNLLDNALAHAPPQTQIEVRAWSTASELLIEVRDEGPGIPEQVVGALFGDGGDQGQLGLGLLQVYHTAQAHGGQLHLLSTDRGGCVQLRLPLVRGSDALPHRHHH